MVMKKYLCHAPKKDSWELNAEALLTSLDGDEMKREQVARQTLSILKERRKHEKKRVGPGRKSNAEHAMEFYEYILSLGDNNNNNNSMEEEEEEQNIPFKKETQQQQQNNDDKDNDNDDNERADDKEERSRNTGNQSSSSKKEVAASSSSSKKEAASSSDSNSNDETSIDTQEFLNQHDDACDVCYMGGEVICCPTCSLVFHRDCLRPQISKVTPAGELSKHWSCPYCIIQGIRGYKRHSKTWKRAEAGARQMKRMKKENTTTTITNTTMIEKEKKKEEKKQSSSSSAAVDQQNQKQGDEKSTTTKGKLVLIEGTKEVVSINSTICSQNDTKTSTSSSPVAIVTTITASATATATTNATTGTPTDKSDKKKKKKKNTSEEKKKEDGTTTKKMEQKAEEMKSSDDDVAVATTTIITSTTTKNMESESESLRSSNNKNIGTKEEDKNEGKQNSNHSDTTKTTTTKTTKTTPIAGKAATTKEQDSVALIADGAALATTTTPRTSTDSSDSKNVNATTKVKATATTTTTTLSTTTPTKKKRKNLALFKIADSYTPHCTESQLLMGRRQRKQPALYQPQLCADSRWQSSLSPNTTTPSTTTTTSKSSTSSSVEKQQQIQIDDDDNGDNKSEENNDDADEDDDEEDDEDDDDDDDDYQDNDYDRNKNVKETPPAIEKRNKKKYNCETTGTGQQVDDRDHVRKEKNVVPEEEKKVVSCVGEGAAHAHAVGAGDEKKSAFGTPPPTTTAMTGGATTMTTTKIWCNFCHDDPDIGICVFCGCRRCFGKHDKTSLLLCDHCDEEYHTYCLGLKTVPLTQRWYCPKCEKKNKHLLSLVDSPRKSRIVTSAYATTSTPGTPTSTTDSSFAGAGALNNNNNSSSSSSSKKNVPPVSTTTTKKSKTKTKTLGASEQVVVKAAIPTTTTTTTKKKQKKGAPEAGKKRPRGRPPKKKETILASTTTTTTTTPIPRKRGPKVKVKSAAAATAVTTELHSNSNAMSTTTTTSATAAAAIPGKKKRGRPRKDANLLVSTMVVVPSASASQPPRKRGRPRKEKNIIINPESSSVILDDKVVETFAKKRGPKPKPKPSTATTTTTTTSIDAINKDVHGVATTTTTAYDGPILPPENVKVSRISGRTVKRASFHDEIDEGEQHLRGFKYHPHHQSGESTGMCSQHTTTTASNSQHESQMMMSEPSSRKKQKVGKRKEENSSIATLHMTTDNFPVGGGGNEFKSTNLDDSVDYLPPVSPVRMKPVVQPPAPAIMWPPHIPPSIEPPKKLEVPTWTTSKKEANKSFATMTTTHTTSEQNSDPLPATASVGNDQLRTVRKIQQPSSSASLLAGTYQPGVAVAAHVAAANAKVIGGGSRNVYPELFSPSIPHELPTTSTTTTSSYPSTSLLDPVALEAAVKAFPVANNEAGTAATGGTEKLHTNCPRRKPGARECMQIARRFGVDIIPENQMTILLDYCRRGKIEHLIRMREQLDCHSRFLESQLAGLEGLVQKVGESTMIVPALPDTRKQHEFTNSDSRGVNSSSINIQSSKTTLPTISDSVVVNVHPTMTMATTTTTTIPVSVSSSAATTTSTVKMAPPTVPVIVVVNDKMPASVAQN